MTDNNGKPRNLADNYPYRIIVHGINGKNVYSDYFKYAPNENELREWVKAMAIVLASEGYKNIALFQVELIKRETMIIETIGEILGEKGFVSTVRIHRRI